MKHWMMKVVSSILLISLLTATLAMNLTSCSAANRLKGMKEPERAVEFMNVLNKNMDSQNSYVGEMEIHMSLEMYGTEISVTGTGVETVCGWGTDDYATRTETHTVMTMNGEDTEMTSIEGFADGKMFYYYDEEGKQRVRLWSAISAEAYVAFDEDYNSYADFDTSVDAIYTEAATRTCVQNKDKTWTATYTDYSPEGLKVYGHMLTGLETMLEDVRVADVILTVNASKELLPTALEMTFVFEPAEETEEEIALPVMTAKATYKDIGSAMPFELDVSNYNEVEDLRVATMVEKSLNDFLGADKAEFKVVTSQKLSYKGQSNSASETDKGTFETDEDGYTFAIDARTGGERYDVTYEDGVYLIMKDGVKKSKKYWSEFQAKTYIKGLLDPASFSKSQVRDIKKDEKASDEDKTVYLVTLKNPDLSQYESMLGGVDLYGGTTAQVTFEDGRMTKLVYKIDLDSMAGYEFVISAVCDYISFENGAEG